MLDGEKKINVELKNNLECNKVNQDMSKNKVEDKKEQCKYKKRYLKYIFFSF